jgi:hypothetical protein
MNQAWQLSTLVWFLRLGAGRNKAAAHGKTDTRFNEVLRRSFGNFFNHCLEFYLKTRSFFSKEFIQPLGQGISDFTWFKEVLRWSLGNFFNHCLEFYLETRGFFPKNLFNHSVRESSLPKTWLVHSSIFQHGTNCLGPPKEFLWANRDIFA